MLRLLAHRTIWSASIILVVATTGCGDETGPGAIIPPPPPPPTADSATMRQFSGAAMNLMQVTLHAVYGGQQTATPNVFILPALGAGHVAAFAVAPAPFDLLAPMAPPCHPVQSGVDTLGQAIDSDADGTPDDYTLDYGPGCSEQNGGLEFTFSGKYRLQDTGNGIADYTLTSTRLSAMVRDTLTGDFFRQSVDGSESAHFSAAHAAHQIDIVFDLTSGSGAESTHVSLRTVAASTFDPAAGQSFQRHASLPEGSFGLSAQLIFRDFATGGDSTRFVLSTPTAIHLAFACDTGIDGGVLRGLLEGDGRVGFRSTWTSCAPAAEELFGATD